jgi:hypothetical protein
MPKASSIAVFMFDPWEPVISAHLLWLDAAANVFSTS